MRIYVFLPNGNYTQYCQSSVQSVQSSLKCLITEFSGNKDLLLLLFCHADHNSKPLYFKSDKKWNKVVVHIFDHRKI